MKTFIKNLSLLVLVLPSFLLSGGKTALDDFYPGWHETGNRQTFTEHDLYGHINGGAELFLEFGFDTLLLSYFKNGESEIALEIYQMESHLSALGIYLMKCGRENPIDKIQTRNTANRYQSMMIRDKYFIQINNFSGKLDNTSAMIVLAQQTIENLPENTEQNIFNQLPAENRVSGSELLIRGKYGLQKIYTFGPDDILDLSGKIFAVLADYDSPTKGTFILLNIRYKNAIHAQKIFLNLKSNLDPLLKIISETKDSFTFSDFKGDFGQVDIDGAFLVAKVNLNSLTDK